MKFNNFYDEDGKTLQEIITQFFVLYYNENLDKWQ